MMVQNLHPVNLSASLILNQPLGKLKFTFFCKKKTSYLELELSSHCFKARQVHQKSASCINSSSPLLFGQ